MQIVVIVLDVEVEGALSLLHFLLCLGGHVRVRLSLMQPWSGSGVEAGEFKVFIETVDQVHTQGFSARDMCQLASQILDDLLCCGHDSLRISIEGKIFENQLFGRDKWNSHRSINDLLQDFLDWFVNGTRCILSYLLVCYLKLALQKGLSLLWNRHIHEDKFEINNPVLPYLTLTIWQKSQTFVQTAIHFPKSFVGSTQ